MSPNETYPQHVVTAVIVAHDGARWLPQVADAVLGQTRPVQRVVAVDTGSQDRSGAVLASKFGQPCVFGMDRATGYGAAIARALHHRAANVPVPTAPGAQAAERVEWLWLLHDDCEPAPDALEQLLRGTAETTSAAVLGPKLRDWTNRDVMLEAGVTLDTATRRVTGIEPREVDQGQHDGDRDALAVSSAGMLVRRDVWDQVGGFDTGMALFMEDIDFCWRVHAAGFRVRVITDAIVYHAQAAARHRRAISVGRRARMLDRRNGLLTLLGNLPLRQMLTSAAGNVLVSALRITYFLLAKRLAAAMDEMSALVAVLGHPVRLIKMRSRRSRGRRAAYSRVRADLPSGRSARRLAEFATAALSTSQPDTAGAHHATDDPTEDDSMLVDNGLGRRLLTSPSLLTFLALLAIALAAGRSLLGSGPLGGGSLVPAWGGASDVWGSYLQTFHPAGIGSTAAAPPWLAVVAALATILAGKTWLAIDVIMIGCVPLAGMTAMLAARQVATSALVRVWASVTYALLPVATGVIASGRFGTAVAFVLLPLILAQAVRMVTATGPRATRAAWATGLLVAVGAAFVPLLWLITLAACVLAAAVFRTSRRGVLRNLAIAALTAPVLLLPWSATLLSNPAGLLLEAGLPQPGTPASGLPARSLMLLSPGGPGLPPYWVTAGLLAVALAALFAGRRRRLIIAGWGVALTGMLAAIVVSHLTVRPPDGGPVVVWAGLPLALAALGLLLAAAAGADALGRLLAGVRGLRAIVSGRGPWAALLALIACSTPVLAAAAWLSSGVSGPIHQVASPVVPELVAVADGQSRQVRTLVLSSAGGRVSYLLLRGPSPSLADSALTPPDDALRALGKAVSALVTPGGGLGADQARLLTDFDIGYVLVRAPVDRHLAEVLSNVSGLRPYSTTAGYSLWQLDTPPARVTVTEPDGTVAAIASGQADVSGAPVPAAGGTLMLSEPAGGWSASLNGQPLTAVPSPAGPWAQAFRLPRGGGTLTVTHSGLSRAVLLLVELLAFLVVAALALPGIRVADQDGVLDADAAGGDEEPAGAAGTRAGRAALAPAQAQRLARGARSRASRGRAAARARVSRGRSGRAAPVNGAGAARPGLDEAAEAAGGLAAAAGARAAGRRRADQQPAGRRGADGSGAGRAGARRGAGRRRAHAGDGDGRDGDGRDDALAGAWPYGAGDQERDGGPASAWPDARAADARDDAWPYPGEQGRDGGPASAWPDARAADARDDAWPYPGEQGREDPLGDAWPYSGQRDRDRGRDDPARRAGSGGRDHAGAWPQEAGRESDPLTAAWPYGAGERDDPLDPLTGPWPRGAESGGRQPYERPDPARGDSWPGRVRPYRQEHDDPLGVSADLPPTAPASRSYDEDQPDPGAGRRGRASGRSPSGAWPYAGDDTAVGRRSVSGRAPDREAPDRSGELSTRAYRISGAAGSPSGSWPYPDSGADDRPGSHRDDELEPLPPIGGSGSAHGRRTAWRPAERDGRRPGRDEGRDEGRDDGRGEPWPGERYSEQPGYDYEPEYEPEYEGDSW